MWTNKKNMKPKPSQPKIECENCKSKLWAVIKIDEFGKCIKCGRFVFPQPQTTEMEWMNTNVPFTTKGTTPIKAKHWLSKEEVKFISKTLKFEYEKGYQAARDRYRYREKELVKSDREKMAKSCCKKCKKMIVFDNDI